jgi:hypothetical protein
MSDQDGDANGKVIGWGCLIAAILLAMLVASFAVIFLWDVNAPH